MLSSTFTRRRRLNQAGISLVELMVAMVLGLLLATALGALFVNVSSTNNEMAKTNSQIENGRFAMQILQNDLAHVGFWGSYVPNYDNLSFSTVPNDVPDTVPNPCAAWNSLDAKNLIGIGVQVYDAAASFPTGTSCATGAVQNVKVGTDILVVRHLEPCLPGQGNCDADNANRLYFQSTLCASESATPYVLGNTGFTLKTRACGLVTAPKRRYLSHIYYVQQVGTGVPTLVRSELDWNGTALEQGAAVALVEGVEDFRVELGIDSLSASGAAVNYAAAIAWAAPPLQAAPTNRGNGSVDGNYIRCTTASPCTAAQLTNAVAASVHLLVRARDATAGYTDSKSYVLGAAGTVGPFNDNFKRHVFTSTVRFNNVSGRRETP